MRRIVPLAVLALASLSCDPTGNVGTAGGSVALRYANFVVDAGPTNVLVDGSATLTSVAFNTVADRYPTGAGSVVLTIRQASDNFLLATDSVNFIDNRRYTLYGLGQLSAFKGFLAVDDTNPAANGLYKVRFINGIGSESAFSLDFFADSAASLTSATPGVSGLGYGFGSGYFLVDTAVHRFRVTHNNNTTAIIDTTLGPFTSGSVVTIVGSNIQGGGSNKFLQVVTDTIP